MSDIHQEWKDLRAKNGEFLNHLDSEMAKIEKKQVELKRRDQMQELVDAGAFAMQFVTPPPFNCCQDDRDILKALNKAQADRIKTLEEELLARKEQQQIDLAVKKDLDEKLDKATADYRDLWVENDRLKEQLTAQGKTLANAQACNVELSNVNAALRQRNRDLQDCVRAGMQLSARAGLKHEIDALHGALDVAAKDADANFERGKIKGMEEIWDELSYVYGRLSVSEDEKVFGYRTVGEIVDNLSPTWFMRKAREYHEQKEKEASVIKLGDEVEVFDPYSPDDDPHSDFAIVIEIDNDIKRFSAVGPHITCSLDKTDIDAGIVKKTGRHFGAIPLDYLA